MSDETRTFLRGQLSTMSVAERLEFVMELAMGPQTIETCPTCGHGREVRGAPIITKEEAREMLEEDLAT